MSCVKTAGSSIVLESRIAPQFDFNIKNQRGCRNDGRLNLIRPELDFFKFSSSPAALLRRPEEIRRRSGDVEMAAEVVSSSTTLILTSGASGRINALFSRRALRTLMMLIDAFLMLLLLPFRRGGGSRKKSSSSSSQSPPSVTAAEEEKEKQQRGTTTVVRVPATILQWKSTSNSSSSSSPPPPRVSPAKVDHDVAARRALAKLRVKQDDDENCIRQFSMLANARGETLFTQNWTPVWGNIRGVVILMHGLNEHSGRYSTFAKQLNANGFKVYGMDWIGHGGSDGLHGYVPSLDFAVADLKLYIEKVVAENPGLPCFCFGHSTGAAIILKAMLDPKTQACIDGVVLTSPAIGVQPTHPLIMVLAPVISFLLPRYQLSAATKPGMPVSRDPAALVAKYSDPLVYTGSIRVRTGYELLQITSYLQQNLSKVRVPFLVLHGTADTVTDPKATQKLYDEAPSTDKTITLYDGLLHDLLFEPEREAITKNIVDWLVHRI